MRKLILSLCDYSGAWSQPYADAGYRVVRVDLGHPTGWRVDGNVTTIGADLLGWEWDGEAPHGVLAAPCCACFCRPAARWWPRQDAEGKTAINIALFRACLRSCSTATGWWALENPPGRHQKLIPELGKPSWQWQPWQYGDDWHKQTYIWGTATKPEPTSGTEPPRLTYRTPNGRLQGRIARMSSSWKTQREQTPVGFARAFFNANP